MNTVSFPSHYPIRSLSSRALPLSLIKPDSLKKGNITVPSSYLKIIGPSSTSLLSDFSYSSFLRRKISMSYSCTRSFTTRLPGRWQERLINYYKEDKKPENYYEDLTKILLKNLEDKERLDFFEKKGLPIFKNSQEDVEYVLELLKYFFPEPMQPQAGEKNRWANYKIVKFEALTGSSHTYSSPSAAYIADQLSKAILHMKYPMPPSIIEVGGMCHNDAFLFNLHLAKEGVNIHDYTGIDIHPGIQLANLFNRYVVQADHIKFMHEKADLALKKLFECSHERNKAIIAIRFLSAIEPQDMLAFFKSTSRLMKENDLFIFNYTTYDENIKRMAGSKSFSLAKEKVGDMFLTVVKRKEGHHVQTAFTSVQIDNLMSMHGLKRMDVIQVDKNIAGVRREFDPYARIVVASVKH
jgi:hypothetical protein